MSTCLHFSFSNKSQIIQRKLDNIEHSRTITTIVVDLFSKTKTDTDQKFFLVGNKLKEVTKLRKNNSRWLKRKTKAWSSSRYSSLSLQPTSTISEFALRCCFQINKWFSISIRWHLSSHSFTVIWKLFGPQCKHTDWMFWTQSQRFTNNTSRC